MPLPFTRVWITGASSGIGRELALRLAREGCDVAASARSADDLAALSKEASELPGSILPVPLDVTDGAACEASAAHVRDALGGLDLVVLNAGTYLPVSAERFDRGAAMTQIDVNLGGTVNMLAAILPAMMETGAGKIAVVASVAGYRGLPTGAAYGATKAALINLCESLKFDLDRAGVRIQVVNPGFVKTPLTDKNEFKMPFLMPVDKAVDRLVSGLASNRFETTFPRRFTWMLKLMRCLPYALYFPIARRATKS